MTEALVLSLGLPHGGAEVQPLTYVLEHWENAVKWTSVRGLWVGAHPRPETVLKMLLRHVPCHPTLTSLTWVLLTCIFQSRFLGRGCDDELFSEKSVFSVKGEAFSEWGGFGLVRSFRRKGDSVKRPGLFSEPPDSESWNVAVLNPFPKISS